jgi:prophage regulatory protein
MTIQSPPEVILRRKQVEAATGLPRSTLYLHIEQGLLTKQVRLGARSVGWPASEVEAINKARVAGLPDSAIRELVRRLHAARRALPGTHHG